MSKKNDRIIYRHDDNGWVNKKIVNQNFHQYTKHKRALKVL